MKCSDCRAELSGLSRYELSELSAPLREHLLQCRECHRIFAALALVEDGASLHAEPSREFIRSLPGRVVRRRRTLSFRSAGMRVGTLAAAAALLIVVGSLAVRPHLGPPSRQTGFVEVHLTLRAPDAKSVSVVGDWNGWKAGAQPLKRHDGTWEISLSMKPGLDYQYQFLVNNDKWIPDPHASLKVVNGFGGVNSVLAT